MSVRDQPPREPVGEAMAVLQEFNTNAKWNAVYRSRRDGLRRQQTYESVLAKALEDAERERAEKERALAEKERERIEKEQALQELERLRVALKRAGVDPAQD